MVTKPEFFYSRSPLGQMIYDIGFTKLSDRYLARKHGMPIAKIRTAREAFKRGWNAGRKKRNVRTAKRRGA